MTTQPDSRALRGIDLFKTRGDEFRRLGYSRWVIPGTVPPNEYLVDLRGESCNCPDFLARGFICKHIYAATAAEAKLRVDMDWEGL